MNFRFSIFDFRLGESRSAGFGKIDSFTKNSGIQGFQDKFEDADGSMLGKFEIRKSKFE